MPSVLSMPTPAIPMPYRPWLKLALPPAQKKLMITAAPTTRMEAAVERRPREIPPMMTVALPVSDAAASSCVGL